MGDSKQSKKTKGSLDDTDKILQDKIATIGLEADRLNENNGNATLSSKSRDELTDFDSSDSLDDLLSFDAHVFTSSSSETTAESDVKELAEKLVNQQIELNIDSEAENGANSEFVNEDEQTSDEFSNSGSDPVTHCLEQQDSNINSTEISAQDKRILTLEVELSDLKKMLEIQTEVNMRLEETDDKLKKMSVLSLVVGICALIMSALLGFLNVSELLEVEQQEIIQDVSSHTATPVKGPDIKKRDDFQLKTNALEIDSVSSTKTLILPEDDISELNPDEIAKLKSGFNPPTGWAVNLSSYGQLWEADKKMEELKKKGILTEMIVVNVLGERWFRVRTTGFKTKAEADSYAVKIKKTLNGDFAWVSKI